MTFRCRAAAGLERLAGARFLDIGMDDVAAAEPMPAADLAAYAKAGRAWVAVDGADEAVGYVVVDAVDGCAHVEQISVVPAHSGKGIVRALLDEVERWAVSCQLAAVTLTTFDGVAWNRLLYEHLGFATLGDGELSAGLRARREAETAHGLDPTTRVYMRRALRRAGRDAG